MAAPAILTQGTTVSISDGSAPVVINGVQSLSGLGNGTASKINVTTLASTAMEYRQGLQDLGDFTMQFIHNADDLGQIELADARASQATREFVLTLPATNPTVTKNVWTANVIVTQLSFDVAANGVAQGSATFAVSGLPVWS
jgi:hypothetical protein